MPCACVLYVACVSNGNSHKSGLRERSQSPPTWRYRFFRGKEPRVTSSSKEEASFPPRSSKTGKLKGGICRGARMIENRDKGTLWSSVAGKSNATPMTSPDSRGVETKARMQPSTMGLVTQACCSSCSEDLNGRIISSCAWAPEWTVGSE